MEKQIVLNGKNISYELIRKSVKHINLRIRADGSIHVSVNRMVPEREIERFLCEKADWIMKALHRMETEKEAELCAHFDEAEIREVIENMCREVYPYFCEKGVAYPKIKFRKMVSCWGNCRPKQGILTFNTNLRFAQTDCIRYVVYHEFTHFLQANHSSKFYEELEKVCPEWKQLRKKLRAIPLKKAE